LGKGEKEGSRGIIKSPGALDIGTFRKLFLMLPSRRFRVRLLDRILIRLAFTFNSPPIEVFKDHLKGRAISDPAF